MSAGRMPWLAIAGASTRSPPEVRCTGLVEAVRCDAGRIVVALQEFVPVRNGFLLEAVYRLVDERHELAGHRPAGPASFVACPRLPKDKASPAKFGLRSSTITRFGSFITVSMYAPVPIGYQSIEIFLPSVMPGCE